MELLLITHENRLPPLLPWADAMALSRSNVPITQKDDSTSSSQKEVIELVRDDLSEVKEEFSRADLSVLVRLRLLLGRFSTKRDIVNYSDYWGFQA